MQCSSVQCAFQVQLSNRNVFRTRMGNLLALLDLVRLPTGLSFLFGLSPD